MLRESCLGPASGRRAGVRGVAIVITDGNPTIRVNDWPAEARRVRAEATVFAVGVTNQVRRATLEAIASNLKNVESVFSVNDFRSLESVLDVLTARTCNVNIEGRSRDQRALVF